MSSAIKTPAFQAKASNILNEDNSSIYSGGEWSFKNASAVTGFHVASDGKVGVGTTSPSYKLDVQGGGARIYNSGAADNSAITYSNGSKNWYVGLRGDTSNVFAIADDSAFRMVIDASGNLLVGTNSDNSFFTGGRLFNSGHAQFTRSGASVLNLRRMTSNGNMMEFIVDNGNIVGNISTNGTSITFSGNAISDERWKENIQPIENALEAVLSTEFVSFEYKENKKPSAGVVAQQLQQVTGLGAFVTNGAEESDYKAVDYNAIVGYLGKAIQELSAKVDAQAAEIEALKAK